MSNAPSSRRIPLNPLGQMSPDDLTTMRDRLGRELTLAEVIDQVKRDHPDEHGDVLVERLKIAIAIFRIRRKTLGLDDEARRRILRTGETQISEGHIIAVGASVGALMIIRIALISTMNEWFVENTTQSTAKDLIYIISRALIDRGSSSRRHRH